MHYRVIFGVLLVALAAQAAPTDDIPAVSRENISSGPLILNEEDREALLRATQRIAERNKASHGEETHSVLTDLVNTAETAANILTKVMSDAQAHEEKSHKTIEDMKSTAPETTDICVQDVFGSSTRASPVYCGVKFFSQVAIGLWDMRQTLVPLKETMTKLAADLAACRQVTGASQKFICNSQAARDGWETSEYVRARLAQHLTVIRFLAVEISGCISANHALQTHLVNKVAECTQANN